MDFSSNITNAMQTEIQAVRDDPKFTASMKEVRATLAKKLEELHAIRVPELAAMDSFGKNLIMKFLCSLALYNNTTTDMQLYWLHLVLIGLEADGTLEEYMRRALELKGADVEDFISLMSNSPNRYYFMIHALVSSLLSTPSQENQMYLSELTQVLRVTLEDLKFLALVAKTIVMHDLSIYQEALPSAPMQLKDIDFDAYFYDLPGFKVRFNGSHVYSNQDQVIFENYRIDITEDWTFTDCDEVIFKNCILKGKEYNLKLNSVSNFYMEGCEVSGFQNRFAEFNNPSSIEINQCSFTDCCRQDYGGVFYFDTYQTDKITISGNQFNHCNVKEKYGAVGYFSYLPISLTITNNEFTDCRDSNGNLFYHSNSGNNSQQTLDNNTVHSGASTLLH